MFLLLLLAAMLTACGSTSASASAGNAPTVTATSASTPDVTVTSAAPTATTATGDSTPAATPTSTSSTSSPNVVIAVRDIPSTQAVGSTFTVLTTTQGMTVYAHLLQGASGFSCDGTCAQTWKPLLFKGTGTPTSTTKLPGKLSVGTDANGNRVVLYQGYYLFTNVNDKAPGDAKGIGADNSPWQPAIPNMPTGL
ncbi:hypothetical protein [Ktedonobacter robiniae]|uniref:hypothetical protein n=1 Tax=Ktedonobacter robiniae TaxID=2778365 RepID=UPI001F1F879D|nr:hypothetical protein [Ktedonobacter robiniae]